MDNRTSSGDEWGMMSLEDAQHRLLSQIQPLPPELITLDRAQGRFSAVDLISPMDLPPFDNSAMDGYAVRCEDLRDASDTNPISLRISSSIPAGNQTQIEVKPGSCARIFTGSPLPAGADSVVMQEDVSTKPESREKCGFSERPKPWENIRFRGEDLKKGERLLTVGQVLSPSTIGLLAACGVRQVQTFRLPVVALLAAGDELVEPGGELGPGSIYESNRAALQAALGRAGLMTSKAPLLNDDPNEIAAAFSRAFETANVIISTGGVSVGDHDHMRTAFESIGGKVEFWRISMKPGKPFTFGTWGNGYWFGLPGNPVSTMVSYQLLCSPALRRLSGASDVSSPVFWCRLAEPLTNPGPRRAFLRGRADEAGVVKVGSQQGSAHQLELCRSNVLVDLSPGSHFEAGSLVRVLPIQPAM